MYSFTVTQGFFFMLIIVTMAQGPPYLRRGLMASFLPQRCTAPCSFLHDTKETADVVCSCSSSCLIYGDCCQDAPFRNTDKARKKLGCLTLSGLGPVSVVNSCPTSSGVLSEACAKGLGATIPVTSRDTGTTYSNYYCALCNKDSFNLLDWPVKFRCCKQDRKIRDETVRESVEYDHERDFMWSVSELRNGSKVFCECKYYARNNDLNFTKSLELRECKRSEISKCIHSWRDESTEKLCSAYMDPVYSGVKIYRNRHCAACNYENEHTLKCSDDPYNPLLMSTARLFSNCKFRGIPNCVEYVRAKGGLASLSDLFSIHHVECAPRGQRCCAGQKFDRYLKICRELPSRIIQ